MSQQPILERPGLRSCPTPGWPAALPTLTMSIAKKQSPCGGCWVGPQVCKMTCLYQKDLQNQMGVTREVHKIAYAKHSLRRQMSAHWEEFSWFRRKGRTEEELRRGS